MKRYVLSSEAQHDLEQIRAYYLDEAGVRVARHVLREITDAFRFVATHPGLGHVREDLTWEPVRFWQVLSYLIVYDPAAQPVGIARVLHARRDIATLLRR